MMAIFTYNLVLFQTCMTLYLQFSGTNVLINVFVHTMTVIETKRARLSMCGVKIYFLFFKSKFSKYILCPSA